LNIYKTQEEYDKEQEILHPKPKVEEAKPKEEEKPK
jgi:hypothetical protein